MLFVFQKEAKRQSFPTAEYRKTLHDSVANDSVEIAPVKCFFAFRGECFRTAFQGLDVFVVLVFGTTINSTPLSAIRPTDEWH